MNSNNDIRTALERWRDLAETDLLCPANPAETDWGAVVGAITATRAALVAAPAGGLVERVAELREKFEQLIKCSRAYDGYSTMTPVELADRLIDAVLKLEADR